MCGENKEECFRLVNVQLETFICVKDNKRQIF